MSRAPKTFYVAFGLHQRKEWVLCQRQAEHSRLVEGALHDAFWLQASWEWQLLDRSGKPLVLERDGQCHQVAPILAVSESTAALLLWRPHVVMLAPWALLGLGVACVEVHI